MSLHSIYVETRKEMMLFLTSIEVQVESLSKSFEPAVAHVGTTANKELDVNYHQLYHKLKEYREYI